MISLLFLMLFAQAGPLPGVNHGIHLYWVTSSTGSPSQGWRVYRCMGTCSLSTGNWLLMSGSAVLPAAQLNWLDQSVGTNAPQLLTTYSYTVASIDANGNLGAYSNVVTIITPAAWPQSSTAPPLVSEPMIGKKKL